MTRVYVDAEALAVQGPAQGAPEPTVDATAERALRFLADAGHEVVVVTGQPDAGPPPRIAGAGTVAEVPSRPTSRAWYLTTEVERCLGVSARVRTVLIGAAPPPGSIHRCDTVARDLQAAALEILASEAMPSR